ncbi:MAG: hypothetical protein RLO52_42785 [Sandaracinaceae bacterium]
MPTIFYSWQTDAPNNVNRSFIEQALERAVRELNAEIVEAERDEVELTQDTQGVPGTPDIAASILAKIESCAVFVCDVSLALKGERARGGTRLCPNPNVMLELGYAMKTRGQHRILMVCNTAFGRIEDLPFDLRGKRPVPYTADATTDLPESRRALARVLTRRIQEIFSIEEPGAPALSPVDLALEAIASQATNRKALVRTAMVDLLARLDALNLSPDSTQASEDELYRVLESSKDVHEQFFELALRIEEYEDHQALDGVIQGFQELAQRFNVRNGHKGVNPVAWFELYYATGRIWLLLATTAIYRRQSWSLLSRLFGARIQVANPRRHHAPGWHSIMYLNVRSDYLSRLGRARGRTSLFADLLKAWADEKGASLPSIGELIDTDLVLALSHRGEWIRWWPETVVYAAHADPLLVHALQDGAFVAELVQAMGISVEQLRAHMRELKERIARWLQYDPSAPLHAFDPDQIGR